MDSQAWCSHVSSKVEAAKRSVDVAAHGEVDENEHVELDEDGEAEEHGVHEQADQAQSLVQGPLVKMDTKNCEEH